MTIMEVSVVPVGTGHPSMGDLVAEIVKVADNRGVKYQLNAMGTNLEGELDELLACARQMHEVAFQRGGQRAFTSIRIDDRRDKDLSMEYKVDSVLERAGV
ncbi:MAG: MTH1187 family thiamine-binding protein [Armatimonadota bacterium]